MTKIHQFQKRQVDFNFQNFADFWGIDFHNAYTLDNNHGEEIFAEDKLKLSHMVYFQTKKFIKNSYLSSANLSLQWHIIQCTRIVKINTLRISKILTVEINLLLLISSSSTKCFMLSVIILRFAKVTIKLTLKKIVKSSKDD